MAPDTPRLLPNSARPEATAAITARTGLTETVIARVVHRFYDRVRADPVLGPIFAERISDWGPHLAQMERFWSSVALMSGRYKGAPMPAHLGLPVDWVHFAHWLALFRQTLDECCTPEGAAHMEERAKRIAKSLHMAVEDHRGKGQVPRF